MNDSPVRDNRRGPAGWPMVAMGTTILVSAALLIAAAGAGEPVQGPQAFQAPSLAAARYRPQDVIGNLGGMRVTIPAGMAELVQYDGDPGWGGRTPGTCPPAHA